MTPAGRLLPVAVSRPTFSTTSIPSRRTSPVQVPSLPSEEGLHTAASSDLDFGCPIAFSGTEQLPAVALDG